MCTVRRAHVLVYKGKAEIVERLDKPLRSSTGSFIWPHVIRLVHYVRVPRAIQRKISRRALFARDGWRCAYCGTTNGRLTLDHIVPRSKGYGVSAPRVLGRKDAGPGDRPGWPAGRSRASLCAFSWVGILRLGMVSVAVPGSCAFSGWASL